VLIGHNLNKSGALFSPEERVRMLDASLTNEMRRSRASRLPTPG